MHFTVVMVMAKLHADKVNASGDDWLPHVLKCVQKQEMIKADQLTHKLRKKKNSSGSYILDNNNDRWKL